MALESNVYRIDPKTGEVVKDYRAPSPLKVEPITTDTTIWHHNKDAASNKIHSEARAKAIEAFDNSSSNPRYVEAEYNKRLKLLGEIIKADWDKPSTEFKQFKIKKGLFLKSLPTATVSIKKWYHRVWNFISNLFKRKRSNRERAIKRLLNNVDG